MTFSMDKKERIVMKRKHKGLSLLLAFMMVLAFMPVMGYAADAQDPEKPYSTATYAGPGEPAVSGVPTSPDNKSLNDPSSYTGDNTNGKTLSIKPQILIKEGQTNARVYFEAFLPDDVLVDESYQPSSSGMIRYGEITDNNTIPGTLRFTTENIETALSQTEGLIELWFSVPVMNPEGGNPLSITYTFTVDVNDIQIFAQNGNPDSINSLQLYTKDGAVQSTEAWCLMKAEAIEAEYADKYDAYTKAKDAAEASKAAAEEAAKTPGDAAVAAAQKALADQQNLQAAMNDLEAALDKSALDTMNGYLDRVAASGTDDEKAAAKAISDEEASAKEAVTPTAFAEVKEAINDAKVFLSDTKADAAKADADAAKAEANAAQASVDALKYTPDSTKITKVKKSKKKATVSFKRVKKNVTGYELEVTNKKTGEVKTVYAKQGKKKTLKKTIKGLSKKTKYSVKVRAYHNVNGKTYYAPWSKAKNFKTKK